MSNGNVITTASLSLLAGSVVRGLLALPVGDVCKVPRDVTFGHARSFIEPTPANKAAFQDLITRLTVEGNTRLLLIAGHTDSTGDDDINQKLSERRVRATWAVLRGDTAEWERLFSLDEGWGTPELIMMRDEVGLGGESDLSGFFGNSQHAKDVRRAMFTRYFGALLGGRAVPAHTAATPDSFGYGREQLLRGDPNNPSRDPTKPVILGDFRPNRRTEFFSFKRGIPIVRDDYPKWAGKCTLTPPPVRTTVAIAPVDTVRKDAVVEFDITVSPDVPPLSNKAAIGLRLSTTSGTGSAVFADNNSNVLTIRGSRKVKVRGVNVSSVPDNVRLTATVIGQRGTDETEDFTVTDAIFIHLQFEVFDLSANSFKALPAGVVVDIMDEDTLSNDRLVSRSTNAQGRVLFSLPDLTDPDEPAPDIFFLVHTRRLQHAGHTLPDEWSTSGWLAADNTTTGLTPDYDGIPIGTPSAPVVFRIGLDLHVRFDYVNLRPTFDSPPGAAFDARAPEGLRVLLRVNPFRLTDVATLHTDRDGEIHAVVFNISAGETIFFNVPFIIEDARINLPPAKVQMTEIDLSGWNTSFADADAKAFFNQRVTTIGARTAPEVFRCSLNDRNLALYMLKVLREWATFLFHITRGAWTGIPGFTIFRIALLDRPFSWPVGAVNMPPTLDTCGFPPTTTVGVPDNWCRDTLIHEFSHQIMWRESQFGSDQIATLFVSGEYQNDHFPTLETNQLTALFEGWADFIAAIFASSVTPPIVFRKNATTGAREVLTGSPRTLRPFDTPPNFGERVEGAFTNGIFGIFANHAVTSAISANPRIPESFNGDIMIPAVRAWLTNRAVQDRFLRMIWRPLQAVRGASRPVDKTSTFMVSRIRALNLANDWHRLQPELQAFNMAMTPPTVTGISPAGSSLAGGQRVVVTGTEFTFGTTTLTIGLNTLGTADVNVINSTTLEAITPPAPLGPVDIIVTTPAGSSAPLKNKFTYAEPPVVTEVLLSPPAPPTSAQPSGPTTGGTSVTIRGRNFDLNAKVFFDGLPPGGVEATIIGTATPTEVPVLSPEFLPPAHVPKRVKVIVRNPDQQFGELDNSFDYVLGPAPRIDRIDPPSGPAGETTVITIHGANFILDRIQVFVDGVRNEDIDVGLSNATQIVTTAKAIAPGVGVPRPVTIRVFNLDGQEAIRPGGYIYV